ncbi:MAG: response regulator [Gammaproteobacteria bacterium]|nr:response regulator [Gammaproteobacteria bacterium]
MKKNALIVDDSRLACKVMANMLETMGIKSVSVYSAEEALEHLKHSQPNIIFLDHTMPGMDGLETIKVIKSNPLTAMIPVMMYTAKEGEVYVGQARALGAVNVLPKGMHKEQLVNSLIELGFIADPKAKEQTKKTEVPVIELDTKSESSYSNEATASSTSNDEPAWKKFWWKNAEPFLNRQKEQYFEGVRYSTGLQTRKLTREFHQTLEHFEHALISRFESMEDFKESKEVISNHSTKRRVFLLGAVFVVLQTSVIWLLYQGNSQSEQSQLTQEQLYRTQLKLEQQLTHLSQQYALLEEKTQKIAHGIETEAVAQSIALVNEGGEVIAENLLLVDQMNGEYHGVTNNGYQFIVNTYGEVGWPLDERFFVTDDCSGDTFVHYRDASVYRGNEGEIWYVDKQSPASQVIVSSKLDKENDCKPMGNEILNLRLLVRDHHLETGIDESQTLKLSVY